MSEIYGVLTKLIQKEICGLSDVVISPDAITPEAAKTLYSISSAHDVSHIVGQALLSLGAKMPEETEAAFKKSVSLAMYRYLQTKRELSALKETLEDGKIPYIVLKGSVLRDYYSEPWMRTSCDIDILIKSCDISRATELLTSELDYKFEGRASHDVSLFSPSGIHVELHFSLIEEGESAKTFDDIWNSDLIVGVSDYGYAMTPETFLTYHVAHMAKHFNGGGCGIRPFIDLWILESKMPYDKDKLFALLSSCGLNAFYDAARLLSFVWLSDVAHTNLTLAMESYVMGGGVYGTIENRVTIRQRKSGGKFRYILGRIFLPYRKLKRIYPRLEKYPFLLPYYEARRWVTFLVRGNKSRALSEISYTASVSEDKSVELATLMQELGLN
ncbi:MAG: nucleotidyltransferase family protein [Clostridia bacterium]|nr:nucleotidyltransferase family protein [Clostridia bacterium]